MHDNKIPQEGGKVVPSELVVTAHKDLDKSIAADLSVPDPEPEVAKAALDEGDRHEADTGDEPAG